MIQSKADIVKIKDETHDVKTFTLKLSSKMDFVPGQFCKVSILKDGDYENETRSFSFSSSPDDELVQLTVKKTGQFTSRLFSLKPGDRLSLMGPLGQTLNFDESVKEEVVFLAAGSGITPFISAIRFASKRNLPNKITLFYSNKTADDIVFKDELYELGKQENITIVSTLTRNESPDWQGEQGRIDKEMLQKYVKKLDDKLWYVCGPPPMVKKTGELLKSMGIEEQALKIEDWQDQGDE